ncbi:MAG: hypothetical protein SGI88_03615 [Candidatus Hydrogenedentes bacterium]|nr:hypothetical protein [Candidatus Hydrogenedentota bacterium]
MRVTFLETRRLSEGGHTVKRFVAGETYDVLDSAARVAITNGWAARANEASDTPEQTVNKIRGSLHGYGFETAAIMPGEGSSISDDVMELVTRTAYARFLDDKLNPPLSYETWKKERMRPVATNPATKATVGESNV